MNHLTLLLILLLSTKHNTQGLVPQGCSYNSGRYTCDFQEWIPPLQDKDFIPGPLNFLKMTNVNGTFPAGAFSGLNGPPTKKQAYLYFYCDSGKTSLSRDIFTENLNWLTQLYIFDCYLETGLPSRLLENLKGLIYVMIRGGGIEGPVAPDALTGLTNLLEVTVHATLKDGELPPGFFHGLKSLTGILLTSSALEFIHPKWFDGLVNLERIYLSNNNLQTLPPGLFDNLTALTHVGLIGNPWHCSCELTWLLDWSNITAGPFCEEPSAVLNLKLEEAMVIIDCTPFSSTSRFWTSEMTTAEQSVISTPAGTFSSTLKQTNAAISSTSRPVEIKTATTLKQESMTSTPAKSIAISMTSINIPLATTTHRTTAVAKASITTLVLRLAMTSMKVLTEDETEATHFLSNISSIFSTRSAYSKSLFPSTSRRSVSLNNSNTDDYSVNGIPSIGILTGVGGALTVLPAAATVLYRRACRSKNIESINNAETQAQGTDPQTKTE